MPKEQILVTGASGLIGSHTIEKLQARAFEGDVRKPPDWKENLKVGQTIFLIAGVRTETSIDFTINADSISILFNTALRLNKIPKKLVLASSQAVYMGNQTPFRESQELLPTTIYGQSKLLGERTAEGWSKKLGIPLVILRYSTVLGPDVREKSKMSGPLIAWTKAARSGLPIQVFQDGNQTRDYIHVDDVVNANILAINLPDGIYNVGGGMPVMLIEVAHWIKEFSKSESEIAILGGEPSPSDPKQMFSDTSKIRSFGWQTKKTAKVAVEEFVSST